MNNNKNNNQNNNNNNNNDNRQHRPLERQNAINPYDNRAREQRSNDSGYNSSASRTNSGNNNQR